VQENFDCFARTEALRFSIHFNTLTHVRTHTHAECTIY